MYTARYKSNLVPQPPSPTTQLLRKLTLEDPPPRPPSRVGSIQTHKNPRQELGNETSWLTNTSILRALQQTSSAISELEAI